MILTNNADDIVVTRRQCGGVRISIAERYLLLDYEETRQLSATLAEIVGPRITRYVGGNRP